MAFPIVIQNVILALARAEAYRRLAGERALFRKWASSNPRSNTSMSELMMQLNEADSESKYLLNRAKIIKRPIVGRR